MMRLIIADDEKIIRETISSFIDWKSLEIEVVAICGDGIEAYNAIVDEYPDIVLTDIKMPGFSGLMLIDRIRQLDKHIEFIILSGYEEFEFARQAMQFGVRHYLLKPCNEKQIIDAVSDIKQNWYMKEATKQWRKRFNDVKIFFSHENENTTVTELRRIFDELCAACGKRRKELLAATGDIFASIDSADYLVLLASGLLVMYAGSRTVAYSPMQLMDYIAELKKLVLIEDIRASLASRLPLIFQSVACGSKTASDLIKKINEYVEKHLSDSDLSLKSLSEDYLYMNVDYVSKQFVKQTGYRFSDYLNRRRIEKAKQLLTSRADIQIRDVAEQIGFGNNPQYLYLIFKKYTGITPASYIKSWINDT